MSQASWVGSTGGSSLEVVIACRAPPLLRLGQLLRRLSCSSGVGAGSSCTALLLRSWASSTPGSTVRSARARWRRTTGAWSAPSAASCSTRIRRRPPRAQLDDENASVQPAGQGAAAGQLDLPVGSSRRARRRSRPPPRIARGSRDRLRATAFIGMYIDWYRVGSGKSRRSPLLSARIADGTAAGRHVVEFVFFTATRSRGTSGVYAHPRRRVSWRRNEHA